MPKIFSLQQVKEFKDFVRSHHGAMTNDEMARQLGIGVTKVVLLIREMKMSKPYPRRHVQHSKYFNVHVHQNWLTGV